MSNLTRIIHLNTVQFDWFTVTSFEYEFYKFWEVQQKKLAAEMSDFRMQQYLGMTASSPMGQMNLGVAMQHDRENYILQITGELAHVYRMHVMRQYGQGHVNVTRADVQITINRPKSYDAVKFLAAMDRKRGTVKLEKSQDRDFGQLYSVNINSRTGTRYYRVYEKPVSNEVLGLRFEVEFKREMAKAVLRELRAGGDVAIRGVLLHELQRLKSRRMESYFAIPIDVRNPVRVKADIKRSEDKTVDWLLNQCLPALRRIVSEHDRDGEVARLFREALDSAEKWKHYGQ